MEPGRREVKARWCRKMGPGRDLGRMPGGAWFGLGSRVEISVLWRLL